MSKRFELRLSDGAVERIAKVREAHGLKSDAATVEFLIKCGSTAVLYDGPRSLVNSQGPIQTVTIPGKSEPRKIKCEEIPAQQSVSICPHPLSSRIGSGFYFKCSAC